MTKRKKILVTGARGFIGRHLQKELEKDYQWSPYQGDVLKEDWEHYFRENPAEFLVHLAWITGPGYAESEKNLRFLQKSIELYRAFYENGGRRAVFVGTEQEYSRGERPLKENDPLSPETLYAICKGGLGQALLEDSRLRGNSFAWGRIFFVYGESEKPARLMPSLINGLLQEKTVVCSCKDFVRDYIHVSDLARGLRYCLEHDGVDAVNLAGGQRTTIGDIAAEVQKQIGGTGSVVFRTAQECTDQPPVIWADVSRLRSFGWEPRVSLAEGIAGEIAYLRAEGSYGR